MDTDDSTRNRVLIVDDDPHMHRIVKILLEKEHLTLDFARNGRIALHRIEQNRYDLIISDIQMPELDGLCLIKKIKEKNTDIPVVLISAYGLEQMTVKAKEAGAVDVLFKPFDRVKLISVINRALNAK